jgi:hypothetical protein
VIRLACTALVALAVGFLAGQVADGGGEPRVHAVAAPAAASADRCPPRLPAPRLTGSDLATLERERQPQGAAGTSEPEPAPELEEPPAESAEQIAAAARARALFDQAMRANRWTDEDAATLRELMGQVSPAVERELLGTLVAALNEQRIELATLGSPL